MILTHGNQILHKSNLPCRHGRVAMFDWPGDFSQSDCPFQLLEEFSTFSSLQQSYLPIVCTLVVGSLHWSNVLIFAKGYETTHPKVCH